MRIALYTLGCKVNQYETQALEAAALERGHTVVPFHETADAYVINTCTVTAVSDRKSRQAIRRAQSLSPAAVVAVCGCYAQTSPDAVAALGVDLVAGTGERAAFLARLEQAAADKAAAGAETSVYVTPIRDGRGFEPLPAGGLANRTRAMLKIEDGCDNFCAYCIIPHARGGVRSLPLPDAAAQAARLAEAGYRELVVTGIEISSWGADFRDGTTLMDAVEAICAAAPHVRVRLGSLEPRTITEDFCRRGAALPNLCPHFHLSLQSGCDATLWRMRRRYDTGRYLESMALLRETFDRPAITTDLIVGFPGEGEGEFGETLDFLDICKFAAVHVFPYSRRRGTPAAAMPGQVPRAAREERVRRAIERAQTHRDAYLQSFVGEELAVLFEEARGGLWQGHAPNYLRVRAAGESLHNTVGRVKVTAVDGDGLIGALI